MSKCTGITDAGRACSRPSAPCGAERHAAPRGIAPPTRIPDPDARAAAAGEPVATADDSARGAPRRGCRRRSAFQGRRERGGAARAEQVTWSDGSLGCPQPGQMYTQTSCRVPIVATTSAGRWTITPIRMACRDLRRQRAFSAAAQPPAAPDRSIMRSMEMMKLIER